MAEVIVISPPFSESTDDHLPKVVCAAVHPGAAETAFQVLPYLAGKVAITVVAAGCAVDTYEGLYGPVSTEERYESVAEALNSERVPKDPAVVVDTVANESGLHVELSKKYRGVKGVKRVILSDSYTATPLDVQRYRDDDKEHEDQEPCPPDLVVAIDRYDQANVAKLFAGYLRADRIIRAAPAFDYAANRSELARLEKVGLDALQTGSRPLFAVFPTIMGEVDALRLLQDCAPALGQIAKAGCDVILKTHPRERDDAWEEYAALLRDNGVNPINPGKLPVTVIVAAARAGTVALSSSTASHHSVQQRRPTYLALSEREAWVPIPPLVQTGAARLVRPHELANLALQSMAPGDPLSLKLQDAMNKAYPLDGNGGRRVAKHIIELTETR
ncbi:MAG TPA: hypothetical protein VLH84_03595 [Patescibacteria group bacterium]|nr:hypothetical protein [Patescibacteria group bacterium]